MTISSGDTAWILVSSALVMLMTPGVALFYGGMVRRKNVLSTIMMSFAALGLVGLLWVLYAYSLSFGPDKAGADDLLLGNVLQLVKQFVGVVADGKKDWRYNGG